MVMFSGTDGGLDFEDGVRLNHIENGYPSVSVSHPEGNSLFKGWMSAGDKEADHWVDALMGRSELYVKPEQAYTVTRILDAVYQSARTGKPVFF